MSQSLEKRVGVVNRGRYKSEGERETAKALRENGIDFEYEQEAYVEDSRDGKSRIWYPDFYLPDEGVIVEFMGMPGDKDYRGGMERKKKTYESMGINFVSIRPHHMWKEGNSRKVRRNFDQYLVRRIKQEAKGRDNKLRPATVKTNAFEDYNYGSYVSYN